MYDILFRDVKEYFSTDVEISNNPQIIGICVKRAIASFKMKRNYPSSYDEYAIKNDMMDYYACIFDLICFMLVKVGAEYQTTHIEGNVHRTWTTENDIFKKHGVIPFASTPR